MRKYFRHIALILFVLSGIGFSVFAGYRTADSPDNYLPQQVEKQDSVKPRYSVRKTQVETYEDLTKKQAADLRDPENVQTTIEYDIRTGRYLVRTRLGDQEIGTPLSLTPEEYQAYSLKQSMSRYFYDKDTEYRTPTEGEKRDWTDMQFSIGAADRIFGPGGVRVRTQGSADITMGLKQTKTDNPTLPERSRNRTFFNFDENVQLNMQASVGTKVNFGMNYNTESSFDFDQKQLNLGYTGDEDEIIKSIQAGNVSMTTGNSLIRGGAALFGIKSELQFGKLRVNALFAQQNSEARTVNAKGGTQTHEFEIPIDAYDENRHFFLGHFFRDQYDNSMSRLPYIQSSVSITNIEVWVTNKQNNYEQSRNIVAFSDLGEGDPERIYSDQVQSYGQGAPRNNSNNLLEILQSEYPNARNIDQATHTLDAGFKSGYEYEKIESARLLSPSEYTYDQHLGYLSLRAQLMPEEVLAVSFKYKMNGVDYQVGEFSTDNRNERDSISGNASNMDTRKSLYVKLLKGKGLTPDKPYWDLMMKNVYSLNAYSVQKDKFRLNVLYQSDTTGTYLNYISEGKIKNEILLRVMNLDNLDSKNEPNPDGFFDFIEGKTIQTETGRIIFPVVEPFGKHLAKKIDNSSIAEKYVFQELYDSTLTYAQQMAEKNKFVLKGEYMASSASEIDLGTTNVARGSVVAEANGQVLTENVDYSVDYLSGKVTILNENLRGENIKVSLEGQSTFNMQRKTMFGLDLNYQFTPQFNLGATIMHLSEMPLTTKATFGNESVKNTLWGFNMSYKGQSQWLTNMLDKIPLLELTQPSQISFDAEFAHLIAGHYKDKENGDYSYLDDFESAQSGYDLLNPYPWQLASVPTDDVANARFPDAKKVNDIDYGKSRSLLAWYYVDGLFTRKNSSIRPKYLNQDSISMHYVRAIKMDELFPNRQRVYNESNFIQVLNVAYYPKERGPYNLDAEKINPDFTLQEPEKRFGGIMRKMDQTDFESANIEYIEFWLLDPYIYNEDHEGGDLYFNLGDVSEDVLKDGKKFFENGLPVDGDLGNVDTTIWGKVPKIQSTVYAFDNAPGARKLQDVGLNGLSSEEEKSFITYADYLTRLRNRLSAETITNMENDPLEMSPFQNPSGDKFHYFRGSDLDQVQAGILDRYKRYNGTEGNSTAIDDSNENYNTASRTLPDVEDLNQDNTLDESERYYEYKVSLRKKDLQEVGQNNLVNIRDASVKLENGNTDTVRWYQFKVPIRQPDRSIGGIRDLKSIRYMRMYFTDFKEEAVFRFGSFKLTRGDWRTYTKTLQKNLSTPPSTGTLEVSSVSIEEDTDRKPVNYILPPNVSRILDPSQPQLRQQNEQSLSMKITDLGSGDARAVYKNTVYDLRRFKRLQMFAHAESFVSDVTDLNNNELSAFIRIGSDYTKNYYEYEVPLRLTPHGQYSDRSPSDQLRVWPEENMVDFSLEALTNLKLERNKLRREGNGSISFNSIFSTNDPDKPMNKISVIGNPSFAEVKVIMIGVRNNSKDAKSAEVWINELRLTDFDDEGGWAARGNLNVQLSDLGSVNLSGHIETAGFGSLDQSISERRMDDFKQFSVAANVELGKFFPAKAQVNIPLYYSYSKETITPQYNPLDKDIKMSDALNAAGSQAEKDSIKSHAIDRVTIKSFALNNVKVGIKSKNPMPYDPTNFSFSYSYNENKKINPETEYETTKDWRGNFAYSYSPYVKPFAPFAKMKKTGAGTAYFKQFAINYLPNNISFQTSMTRNYYEIQLRDLSGYSGEAKIPASFSQNWTWDRAFSITWNLTNNLMFSLQAGTNARIEEPHVQVNKKFNPDQYQVWKDSVKQSIRDLGRPMLYDQTFNATYTFPFQSIPALNWINGSATYNAMYNWERGAVLTTKEEHNDMEIGNVITNQRSLDVQGNFNMQNLYNKNTYLKEINQRFTPGAQARQQARKEQRKQMKVEKEVVLNTDSNTVLVHNMLTKDIRVVARTEDGKIYRNFKFKPDGNSRIKISTRDSVKLNLTLTMAPPKEEHFLSKMKDYSTRFLMMVRRFNIQYKLTDGMTIPGFRPEIGDWIGQGSTPHGNAPGFGFAFGAVSRRFIDEANEKGWLVNNNQYNINPAMMNSSKTFTVRMNLEPITGLKIDLNANRVDTRTRDIYYMFEDTPDRLGGNFVQTTVALSSAFSSPGNAKNGYRSSVFEKFLSNRETITGRVRNQYTTQKYPTGTSLAGDDFNPSNGDVNPNSADVLIPAFLAAYTNKSAGGIELTAFPSLSAILPNWRVTYEGLNTVSFIKKHFKNFILSHAYTCTYRVGSFSSLNGWISSGADDLGYIRDVLSGNPIPSSPFDISSVSLNEAFVPLFGIDATFHNNITTTLKFQKTRNINLNISSVQLVESLSNEFVIGIGYQFAEFNKVLKMRKKGDFNNDLTVRLDFSHRKTQSLIRKISENNTQATSGNIAKTLQFSADYALSRMLTVRAFYDMQINEPLISSSAYPTTNSNYGISLRISLTQ